MLSNHVNRALAIAASLMLTFVFTGCSASGPFQAHSAFKQAVLPSGYQSFQNQAAYRAQGASAPQWQAANYPPGLAPQNGSPAFGFGASPQPAFGFGGQAAFPQNNQGFGGGLISPFVGRNYNSGSC